MHECPHKGADADDGLVNHRSGKITFPPHLVGQNTARRIEYCTVDPSQSPRSGRDCEKSPHAEPELTNFGPAWGRSYMRISVEIATMLNPAERWPTLAQLWPASAQTWPASAKFGRDRHQSDRNRCRSWHNSGRCFRLVNLPNTPSHSRLEMARIRPELAPIWPSLSHIRQIVGAGVDRTLGRKPGTRRPASGDCAVAPCNAHYEMRAQRMLIAVPGTAAAGRPSPPCAGRRWCSPAATSGARCASFESGQQ